MVHYIKLLDETADNRYLIKLKHLIRPLFSGNFVQPIIAPKRGKLTQPTGLTTNEMNQYFTSIGTETHDRVAADFRQSGRSPLSTRLPRVNADAMAVTAITIDQLKRAILSLPNKTSPIHDDIPIRIFKLAFDIIGRVLLRIINK